LERYWKSSRASSGEKAELISFVRRDVDMSRTTLCKLRNGARFGEYSCQERHNTRISGRIVPRCSRRLRVILAMVFAWFRGLFDGALRVSR
jgi:hypothetical protein